MDESCEAQEEMKMVCSDSVYGSSTLESESEDKQTFPYNEDLTHKVITFALLF